MHDETWKIDSSSSGGFRFPNRWWPIVYLEIGAIRTRGSYVEMHLVRKCKTGGQFVAVKGLGEPGQEDWLPSFRAGFRGATGGRKYIF
jgi:hypothetical protein